MKRFFSSLALGCALAATTARAGVAIDIGQEDYEKLLDHLDKVLNQLPYPLDLSTPAGTFALKSGVELSSAEILKIGAFSGDEMVEYMKKQGLQVRVFCAPQKPRYLSEKYACEKVPKAPDAVAAYRSPFVTDNKSGKPELILRSDVARVSVLKTYLHFLQDMKAPALIGKYTYKNLRGALEDSLLAKPEGKKEKIDETILKGLVLTGKWLDDAESLETLMRFRHVFRFTYGEVDEVFQKSITLLDGCNGPRCKTRRTDLEGFANELLSEQVRARIDNVALPEIPATFVKERMASWSGEFQPWFDSVRGDFYKAKGLDKKKEAANKISEGIKTGKILGAEKNTQSETMFAWMAENAVVQYMLLAQVAKEASARSAADKAAVKTAQEGLVPFLKQSSRYGKEIPAL